MYLAQERRRGIEGILEDIEKIGPFTANTLPSALGKIRSMSRKVYRRYDPRLKNLVAKSNDISHFYKLGIPKSTLKQWKICGPLDYFSIPELDFSDTKLLQENVHRHLDFGKNKANK